MNTYRVTYKPVRGDAYMARIVTTNSDDPRELSGALGYPYAIRSISLQCEGTAKNGYRCQRWTSEGRCRQHGG